MRTVFAETLGEEAKRQYLAAELDRALSLEQLLHAVGFPNREYVVHGLIVILGLQMGESLWLFLYSTKAAERA